MGLDRSARPSKPDDRAPRYCRTDRTALSDNRQLECWFSHSRTPKLSQSRKAQNCLFVMAPMRLRVLRPLALSYRCSVLRVPPSQANLTIADPRRRHALHRGRCPRLYPGIVEGSWPKKKRPPVRRGLALFIAGQGHQSARRGRSRAALVRHYCSLLMSMSLTESSSTEKSTATMVASLPITTAAWLAILARRWRTRRRQPHALDSRFRLAHAR